MGSIVGPKEEDYNVVPVKRYNNILGATKVRDTDIRQDDA